MRCGDQLCDSRHPDVLYKMPRPTAAQHWFEWHAFTAPGGQPTLLMLTTPGLRVYAQLWDLRSGAVVCTLEHGVGSWQVHVDLGVFAYISSYVSSQLPLFSAESVYVSVWHSPDH